MEGHRMMSWKREDSREWEPSKARMGTKQGVSKLYDSGWWLRRRRRQLMEFPLCAMCLADGRAERATICDHVERHHGSRELFLNGAVQSLCSRCHSRRKQSMEQPHGHDPGP